MLSTVVMALALAGAPKAGEPLVGTWLAGGTPFMTLNANGTGQMEDGRLKWSADGKTLLVTDEDGETDRVPYTLDGSTLTLSMGGMPLQLTRAGAGVQVKKPGVFGAKAAKAARGSEEEADREAMAEAEAFLQKNGQAQARQGPPEAADPSVTRGPGRAPPTPRAAGTDQLSQLLLSSAWCSFTYNQRTGASSTSRYQFHRDGTWSTGARAETYNTGTQGTVAGQYDSSNGGRWEVRNGALFMATAEAPQLQPVTDFRVSRNSNGAPIITADGREFAACN